MMIHRRSRPTVEERSKKATPNAVGVAHYAPLGAAGIMALIGPFCKPHVQRGVMIAVMRFCGRFRTSEPPAKPFFSWSFCPCLGGHNESIMNGFIASCGLCRFCYQKAIKCAASPVFCKWRLNISALPSKGKATGVLLCIYCRDGRYRIVTG